MKPMKVSKYNIIGKSIKIFIVLLIILLLFGSCTTVNWNNLSQSEKRTTIILTTAYVLYAGGMTYWIVESIQNMDTEAGWFDEYE